MLAYNARPYKYLIVASVIIPVLLFSYMMWRDYKTTLNDARVDAIRTVNIFQQHAFNVFETHQLIVERINEKIMGLSWDEIARSKEIRFYLENIEKEYPQVQAIWLVDSSGIVRNASKTLPDTPVNVADRGYFQALRAKESKLYIGEIVEPRVLKNLNFNVARRRGNSSVQFDGVIVLTVFPEYFSKFWNKVTSTQNSAAVLIRSDGSVLARSLGINPKRLKLPPDSEQMKAISRADQGSYISYSVHDGIKRIFAFQKVDKYNVYLIHGISMNAVFREWQQHLVHNGPFFSIAIVILLLLAISVNRHAKSEQAANDALREKEARLRFHMDNSPMSIIEWDKDFIVTRWTGASEQMFGWNAEEVIGKPLSDLKMIYENDVPIVEKTMSKLTDGLSQKVIATNRNYTKSGNVIYCTWYNSVLTDQKGQVRSVFSKVIDITKLKQAEKALRLAKEQLELRVAERTKQLAETVETLLGEMASRERSERNLQSLNKLYAVLSETNQTILRAGSRDSLFDDFCRIAVVHGGFLLSWVGMVVENTGQIDIVASNGATGYLEDIRISTNYEATGLGPTGISVREGSYHICNDFQNDPCTQPWHARGKAYGIYSSAAIALKEDGKVVGVLTLYAGDKDFFDQQHVELLRQMGEDVSFALDHLNKEESRRITEQALREETLERLRTVEELRKQEQLLIQQSRQAAMGEMIGNIAHQWRQPLNTLNLYTERLRYFYGSSSFDKEFLDTSVAKSMEIIQYMSRTIDDFRNFFSDDQDKTNFKADEAVKKALALVEANFKEHRITIEIIKRKESIIHGFPNEYAQVLLNILINAKDALSERNVESPHLKITINSKKDISVVTISDNAGGIQEDIINKIFDPYFTTKGPQQGTGVGLFMSKTIIENKMGGRLSVRNIDEGAEFRIEV